MSKAFGIFSDPNKNIILQIELAAIVDWGEPFVKTTYRVEGDGALAFECFEVIDTIRAFIQSGTTPNIQALADRLSCGVPNQRQLVLDHVHNCVKPAIDYFNLQLASTLNRTLSGFKAARFFYTQKAHEMQPTALCIDSLTVFPYLFAQRK